jgi:transcription-repair coupling factor (superfamily II helicase)
LIVNRADTLGLSQLYQLRGRIGRSHRQAYAFLLIPPRRSLSATALRRLETIEEFNDLGAGFDIARRDLELRGAGNLLGNAQTGFLNSLGYDMYNRILEEAVNELKGETPVRDKKREVKIQIPADAFIPDTYVEADTERVNLYKRLGNLETTQDLEQFRGELEDRFGKVPLQTELLLAVFAVRLLAADLELDQVNFTTDGAVFSLPAASPEKLRRWMERLGSVSDFHRFHLDNTMPPRLTLEYSHEDWLSRTQSLIKFLRELAPWSTLEPDLEQ